MPNNFIRCLDPDDYPPIQPIRIEQDGVVFGADGNAYYQEVAQTVADIVHVGDVVAVFATYYSAPRKNVVVDVSPQTDCTCNNEFCANRIGAAHPAADQTGEYCYLLKCWTLTVIETDRTPFRSDGKYRDTQLGFIHECIARDGKIVSMATDDTNTVTVIERGVYHTLPRQERLFDYDCCRSV